jgi:hypothetical protein
LGIGPGGGIKDQTRDVPGGWEHNDDDEEVSRPVIAALKKAERQH